MTVDWDDCRLGEERMRACEPFAQELQRARAAGGAWGSTNEFATPLATQVDNATPVRGGAYV